MLGNPKALKRNDRERRGILIGPSMAPRFSRHRNSIVAFFQLNEKRHRLRGKFRRTDGKPKPTNSLPFGSRSRERRGNVHVRAWDGAIPTRA